MVLAAPPKSHFESTLPGRYYIDPEIYAREQERIFSEMWVCVGRADDVPAPGQIKTVNVGRESVLIIRGRDGQVRAFLNVCRHRGARLCVEPEGTVGAVIQCKYHAWSYAHDGRLVGAPNMARDEHFNKEEYGLVPVHLAVWHGLIWVNLSDDPAPAEEQLNGPVQARLGDLEMFDRWEMGRLVVGKRIEYEFEANWKITVENFMECYHCGPVHPELVTLIPEFRNGTSYQGLPGQGTSLGDDIEAFTLSGKGNRPPLRGLRDEDKRQYFAWVQWPNVFINLLDDHVIVHTLFPISPTRSKVVCDWLFDPEIVAASDFDPADTVAAFDITNKQDWDVCELTQMGMGSKAFASGGIFVANELHITAFRVMFVSRLV
jgi:Rieske 2Fe-2S family protein